MAVLGITKSIEEQTSKKRQEILVIVNDSEESEKVFEAAVEMVKESGGRIILAAVIDKNVKPPYDFYQYVKNEKIDLHPDYAYKIMLAEELLRPYEEKLKREGIEYSKIIETENSMKKIASLANNLEPARIIIGINQLRKATRGLLKRQNKFVERITSPITIIP